MFPHHLNQTDTLPMTVFFRKALAEIQTKPAIIDTLPGTYCCSGSHLNHYRIWFFIPPAVTTITQHNNNKKKSFQILLHFHANENLHRHPFQCHLLNLGVPGNAASALSWQVTTRSIPNHLCQSGV